MIRINEEVWVNPAHVTALTRWTDKQTRIHLVGGSTATVDLSIRQVIRLVKGRL